MAVANNRVVSLAYTAMISAVLLVLMIASRVISVTDLSIALLCGIGVGTVRIECGMKWAISCWLVVGVAALFIGEPSCALLFAGFFGYYPVIKPWMERLPRALEWCVKLFSFNGVVALLYWVLSLWVGTMFANHSYLIILGFLFALNIVFIVYDVLFNRIMSLYFHRVHPIIEKKLRR